ncbi:ABC transporter permease DevC [Gloeobacter violaceus]|uniref:Gll1427 protein n=1 Tax=Gloeobacter violaceus (strain ATCC 29082 / PCC 7421) TaxID=251221 RepID=Q7NKQ0_GLOVI|nr:ABC transporter permease DevC [Gloeobacter violaceus]BAC89368.1 gll1427 [Gloeobacter violaceus PCC 7421]
MKMPLAWLQLTRERVRLLVAVAGIGFAVILMFLQLGFRAALFDGAVRLHASFEADIFLIGPKSSALVSMQSFSQRRLYQAMAVPGVAGASPVYLDFGRFRNPESNETRGIFVVGFNPGEPVFRLGEVNRKLASIRKSDTVLFDRASRSEYGPIASRYTGGQSIVTEVNDRRVRVGGLFQMGTSFAINGTLITSDLNFLRLFGERSKGLVDLGLVRLTPGADPERVKADLRAALPADVRVLSRQEYMDFEKDYWNRSTPIGYIFALGAAMGFIVGTIIVYQILYTDVSDHLAEYATLKAIGYTNGYLLGVVFQEAFLLSLLGFVPGFAISLGLYDLTRGATLLPLAMDPLRAAIIFALTVLMCAISGAIAVRRLRAADPAEIFA